jgi:MFS family permease
VLLATWGVGILLGSLVYILVKQRSVTGLIIVSTAALGIAYLGMAASATLLAACLFSVLGGTGNGIQWIAVMTALQEATPRNLQARVTGLLESLGAAMPGVGYLVGGILASIWNPRTAYWVAGAGVMVLVILLAIGRTRLDGTRGIPSRRRRAPSDVSMPEALTGAPTYEHEHG